jgi:hypothetical protein
MFLDNIFKNINYVILRNYNNLHNIMPLYPDDIDILTDDYDKILNMIKPFLIKIDNPNVGHILKYNNKKIKLDIRVVGDNYYDINWEQNILDNKILYNNFYIPNENNYKYSILYHCLIHKNNISKKYNKFIKNNFGTNDNNKLFLILEKFIATNNYNFVKPSDINCGYFNKYKNTKMLFLIRKTGLIQHTNIIEDTTNTLITNNYHIYEEGIVTINNKKEFLKKLYNNKINNNEIMKSINKANDNICYYFITDYNSYTQTSTEIKNLLRKQYPNPNNIHWNYFHSSDSIKDAYKEIKILKSNILNFKNIGTYYSQKYI